MPTRGDKKVKKHITTRRWGLRGRHPKKKYPPLDKELLDHAISYLGDAAFGSRAYVKPRVDSIVNWHRTLEQLEQEQAPRLKHVISNLGCVRQTAKDLRSHLSELDYLSLRELRQHGAFEHPSLVVPIDDTKRRGNELIAIGEQSSPRPLLTI